MKRFGDKRGFSIGPEFLIWVLIAIVILGIGFFILFKSSSGFSGAFDFFKNLFRRG